MVERALAKSRIIFGTNSEIARTDLSLLGNTGILYPSAHSRCLTEIRPDQRPDQLIVIDGTWSQAKTMVRDIPQLQGLPHFKINPEQPGQYKIRLEPDDTSLSTVEATVAALKANEPETVGLDQLLVAFATMVDRQLNHPRVGRDCYTGGRNEGRTINVPGRLCGDPSKIVVAYGEAAYRDLNAGPLGEARLPLVWMARRLAPRPGPKLSKPEGSFARSISTDVPLTDSFLEHLQLPRSYFDRAISPSQFCEAWDRFSEPDDVLVVFNQGTLQLLRNIGAPLGHPLTLKSIHFDKLRKTRTLSEFLDANQVVSRPLAPFEGRAGLRLANAVALVQFLRAQSSQRAHNCPDGAVNPDP